ncbi:MAG: PAS domain S-box protein [Desulfobacteraceae bacterium]|nr:PAS domain S-box protein [Desulfobacteraceae bacterium]MCF8094706.1 PAS domain S-box protein [Desulfobacteraceae bacterium]
MENEELNWRLRVFDSLSYPTLIIKPDYTLESANRRFFEIFGQRAEEIKGEKCYQFFYGTENPCNSKNCPLVRVLHTKQGYTLPWRNKDRWEDRVFSPILDDDGEVAYIIESIRDVTRIKKLESELSGIKELISRVVHSSASAIIAADKKGGMQLMNPAAKELFKVGDNARHIKNAEQLYPPGKAKEIMSMLRDENTGGKGKLSGIRTNIVAADGEEITVELSAAIIYDDDDNESATMAIYNDLRKKLEIEKQLKEAQKQLAQSEKMASLGQLAAGVAHEINNPLTGILMYAGMIMEHLDENSQLRRDIECIIEDANRCREIVKSLLAYSRSSDSKRSIIHVNDLVEQSFKLTRDQKIFRNIHIEKQLSEEMMLLNVDTNKLSQVIINLVINAADAMDGEGRLTVRTCRDKSAQKIFLEISDTGYGISEENLSKIFDPFFSTKPRGKSTGLGLSIAYGIVEEHGGRISVKETGPGGTTFLLELPQYIPAEE